MSVLREVATDDEFRAIIVQRLNKPKRMLKGFITVSCDEIRKLRAKEAAHGLSKGDRLYYVTDTDMEGLPHHADIFATVPTAGSASKALRRLQRNRMMELLAGRMQPHEGFRGGAFSEFAVEQPAVPAANGAQA